MKLKKIFIILFVMFFSIFLKSTCVLADSISINKERIEDYEITQTIQADGSISVEEQITFDSFGDSIQNGLVRTCPKQLIDDEGRVSNVLLSDFSLKLDNVDYKFSVNEDDSNNIFIYMGDTKKLLTNGKHIFTLKYKIEGLIAPYSYKYDKYFFFPTGDWNLSIEKTTIKIIIPEGRNITLIQTEIKKEGSGETSFSKIDYYSIKDKEKGEIILIPSKATLSGESLSLSILLPKDFININRTSFYLKYFGFYIVSAIIFLFSIFLLFMRQGKGKLLTVFLFLIPFIDIIPGIFIFNKNNTNFFLSLFTILLILEVEAILSTLKIKTNRKFNIIKYSIIVFFVFFYFYYLINFSLKLQAIILLSLILLQVIILDIKKKALN